MRKNLSRQVESDKRNGGDLRETLSRVARPRPSAVGGSIRQHAPEPTDSRHFVPEQKNVSMLGRIPSMRSSDAFLRMDSLRNSYSPWTLDSLRQRSPDRVVHTSRNLSPPRNDEQIGKRPLIRTYDDARRFSYLSRDILEPRRPMGTSPYMTRPTVSAASVKPVVPLPAPPPPPSGIAQKSSYTVQVSCPVFLFDFTLPNCKFKTIAAYQLGRWIIYHITFGFIFSVPNAKSLFFFFFNCWEKFTAPSCCLAFALLFLFLFNGCMHLCLHSLNCKMKWTCIYMSVKKVWTSLRVYANVHVYSPLCSGHLKLLL